MQTDTEADIYPAYYDLTIPPNIAPLNFIIREPGSKFCVQISAGENEAILIRQRSSRIHIPMDRWKELLSEHTGDTLKVQIWARQDRNWTAYPCITHLIATDPIDPFIAYRIVHAVYLNWRKMGIYQRDLTSFREIPLIENSSTGHGCMNCHSFANNDPSTMMIHFRIINPGTLIWNQGTLMKVNTSTESTMSAGIYPSWHPDGKHIAFSTGKISPHLTTRLNKVVDVADRVSDLIVYDVSANRVTTSPEISTSKRENMPAWSADGKYMYFICAPEAVRGDEESLLHSRYSLMRIAYDPDGDIWGEAEMVLNADTTGMSISHPSVSPNGKYLVCSMSDFGYFTIFHQCSDLYSVNLETREYRRLGLNSEYAESHPSWSSNGRWLVFSSKRMDGVLSRPHIAYFDNNGNTHAPFVLPQKDPSMYDRLVANYNLPRLLTGRIDVNPLEIREAIYGDAINAAYKE
ncbi:MAG TPA: hypothetical protein ENO05_03080 [Bacteroides sp.]|nr:hypothetical protein [Bacteroides sp.]